MPPTTESYDFSVFMSFLSADKQRIDLFVFLIYKIFCRKKS